MVKSNNDLVKVIVVAVIVAVISAIVTVMVMSGGFGGEPSLSPGDTWNYIVSTYGSTKPTVKQLDDYLVRDLYFKGDKLDVGGSLRDCKLLDYSSLVPRPTEPTLSGDRLCSKVNTPSACAFAEYNNIGNFADNGNSRIFPCYGEVPKEKLAAFCCPIL